MTEHTPTPWKFVPWHIEEGPSAVRAPDGHLVCSTASDANAAFIVKAVNNHDAFVATLRDFIDILDGAMSGFIPGCGSDLSWHKGKDERIANARALLAGVSSPGERQ